MAAKRDTYKYYFKIGRTIVHRGITDNLDRREGEHQRKPGWSGGHILQVGNRTTEEAARDWEEKQGETYAGISQEERK